MSNKTLDELPHGAGVPMIPGGGAHAASRMILDAIRLHGDRAEALLQALQTSGSSPNALLAQRAALVDALAETLAAGTDAGGVVSFVHPLAISDAARHRFNLTAPARAGGERFAFTFNPADWDRSMAIDAPGQSGSPESVHYADLLKLWSAGEYFPLAFSERAVQAAAEATLTLLPK